MSATEAEITIHNRPAQRLVPVVNECCVVTRMEIELAYGRLASLRKALQAAIRARNDDAVRKAVQEGIYADDILLRQAVEMNARAQEGLWLRKGGLR